MSGIKHRDTSNRATSRPLGGANRHRGGGFAARAPLHLKARLPHAARGERSFLRCGDKHFNCTIGAMVMGFCNLWSFRIRRFLSFFAVFRVAFAALCGFFDRRFEAMNLGTEHHHVGAIYAN